MRAQDLSIQRPERHAMRVQVLWIRRPEHHAMRGPVPWIRLRARRVMRMRVLWIRQPGHHAPGHHAMPGRHLSLHYLEHRGLPPGPREHRL
jgi:hypothetical protein